MAFRSIGLRFALVACMALPAAACNRVELEHHTGGKAVAMNAVIPLLRALTELLQQSRPSQASGATVVIAGLRG